MTILHGNIYLDCNAAAPPHPAALAALDMFSRYPSARNPSSPHAFGRAARSAVEKARAAVKKAAGARTPRTGCLFTASGTEANNTVFASFGYRHIFIAEGEHASVTAPAAEADKHLYMLPLTADGTLCLNGLQEALAQCKHPEQTLVSVCAAHSETGVLHDIAAIAAIVKEAGAALHTDASQGFGKTPFSYVESGADYVTVSAHKAGGLAGAAALLYPLARPCDALLKGGGQEGGARSGTENVLAIEAFGAVADHIGAIQASFAACEAPLRAFEQKLKETAGDDIRIYGEGAPRLPNTCCFATKHIRSESLLIACDMAGYAVSAGSACSSARITASPVLQAIDRAAGIAPEENPFAGASIRVSMCPGQGEEELAGLFELWKNLYGNARP